jgi:DNA invertase Pin-like site-specific DNA recombinase
MTRREINAIHSACFRRSWDDDTDDASRVVFEQASLAMTVLKSQVKERDERLARQAIALERAELRNVECEQDAWMRSVMAAAAEFERGLIRQRTKSAMAAKRRAGERCGQVPFGWSLGEDGTTLVPVEEEQRVIEAIIRCREAGMSSREIAGILTEKKSGAA